MTANEIADELDGRLDHVAANMLRQQQEEIMRLNERIHALESQIFNGSVK
jgi:predicted transcriptional regulator